MIPISPGFFRPHDAAPTILLWFDASDSEKIVVNESNEVESITCKVTGKVWSQSTASNRPIFGSRAGFSKSVMDFNNDGTNKYVTGDAISIPTACTAFFVIDWESNALYRAFCLIGGNQANAVQGATGQPMMIVYSTISGSSNRNLQIYAGGDYTYTTSTAITTPGIATFNVPDETASNTNLYWNDNIQSNSSTAGTYGTSMPFITLGSTDSTYLSKGYVGEVIIYAGSLSADEMSSIVSGLYSKWFS